MGEQEPPWPPRQRTGQSQGPRETSGRFQRLYEETPAMLFSVDPRGRVLTCNAFGATYLGYRVKELVGSQVLELFDTEDRGGIRRQLDRCLERPGELELREVRKTRRDGSTIWVREGARCLSGDLDEPIILLACEDITERKQAEARLLETKGQLERLLHEQHEARGRLEELQKTIMENSPAYIMRLDLEAKIRSINRTVPPLSRDDVLGTSVYSYLEPSEAEKVRACLERVLHTGKFDSYEVTYRDGEGRARCFEARVAPVVRDDAVVSFVVDSSEVTRQKGLEQAVQESLRRLEHQAFHDSLTDLRNRAALHRDFRDYLDHQASPSERLAILLIDLDRFKDVNDALGHHVGDKLLQQVGPRLNQALPSAGLRCYRLGGDEFAVFLPGLAAVREALELARALLPALRRPFDVEGLSLEIGASAGVSVYPELGASSNELLRGADVALYEAKRALSGVALYDPATDPNTRERLAMASDLSRALEAGELVLHYQPKVSLQSGRTVGFEALVRWQHTERGLLAPAEFLPLAEVGELIHPLTDWVVEHALAQLRRWSDRDPGLTMAVNLSGRNLLDRRFANRMKALIKEAGVDPGCVEFEITETVLMTDLGVAIENLRRLAATGARLSIDDFGTGYSSFAYLKRFAIHSLKLDRTFVKDLLKNSQSRAIVLSTIQLAANLGLQMVAEGVENSDTGKKLQAMGCQLAQGYRYGRPRPAGDFGVADAGSTQLTAIRGVGEVSATRLLAAGFATVGAVASAEIDRLMEATRFPSPRALAIRDAAAAAVAFGGTGVAWAEAATARTEKKKPTLGKREP